MNGKYQPGQKVFLMCSNQLVHQYTYHVSDIVPFHATQAKCRRKWSASFSCCQSIYIHTDGLNAHTRHS